MSELTCPAKQDCRDCDKDHATYLHEVYAGTLPEAGRPIVFGVHRLPAAHRWPSPLRLSYVASEAAWSRFIREAKADYPEIAARLSR